MTLRRTPETAAERIANLEETVRRLQASTASAPVVTDYSALKGKPTDLATLADVAAAAATKVDWTWFWAEVAP